MIVYERSCDYSKCFLYDVVGKIFVIFSNDHMKQHARVRRVAIEKIINP